MPTMTLGKAMCFFLVASKQVFTSIQYYEPVITRTCMYKNPSPYFMPTIDNCSTYTFICTDLHNT